MCLGSLKQKGMQQGQIRTVLALFLRNNLSFLRPENLDQKLHPCFPVDKECANLMPISQVNWSKRVTVTLELFDLFQILRDRNSCGRHMSHNEEMR